MLFLSSLLTGHKAPFTKSVDLTILRNDGKVPLYLPTGQPT
jgi:hypothetical protein